jgi:hypothetical protein
MFCYYFKNLNLNFCLKRLRDARWGPENEPLRYLLEFKLNSACRLDLS